MFPYYFTCYTTKVVVLSSLLCFVIIDAVNGWGKIGHEIVGNIAWMLLSTNVQNQVSDILNISTNNETISYCDEYCSPLAIVADWADRARYTKIYHWTAPLHYIDIRDDLIPCNVIINDNNTTTTTTTSASSCHFEYERDCPNNFCVAGAIVNYTNHLIANNYNSNNKKNSIRTSTWLRRQRRQVEGQDIMTNKKESLMFITHFIGDIHQPLHCARGSDRGGNTIHVHDYFFPNNYTHNILHYHYYQQHSELNLHTVWDDTIIETTLYIDYNTSRNEMELSILNDIYMEEQKSNSSNNSTSWIPKICNDGSKIACTSIWAEESLRYALQYSYINYITKKEIIDGTNLTNEYYQSTLPIIKQRLAVAGIRLAATLEKIYG